MHEAADFVFQLIIKAVQLILRVWEFGVCFSIFNPLLFEGQGEVFKLHVILIAFKNTYKSESNFSLFGKYIFETSIWIERE